MGATIYNHSYNYDLYNFSYLTGWIINAGSIVDNIQFQFTKSILTANPTISPTMEPTINPTISPTISPTMEPTTDPTKLPTISPTVGPALEPSINPTKLPSILPTLIPSTSPTLEPTKISNDVPTISPTEYRIVHKNSALSNTTIIIIMCVGIGVILCVILVIISLRARLIKSKESGTNSKSIMSLTESNGVNMINIKTDPNDAMSYDNINNNGQISINTKHDEVVSNTENVANDVVMHQKEGGMNENECIEDELIMTMNTKGNIANDEFVVISDEDKNNYITEGGY